jgi:hypothetical protein
VAGGADLDGVGLEEVGLGGFVGDVAPLAVADGDGSVHARELLGDSLVAVEAELIGFLEVLHVSGSGAVAAVALLVDVGFVA